MLGPSIQDWEVKTQGTYGEFHTLAGKVSYLMTKAKLKADTTPEGILTKYLAPVREVLNIDDLDFNQLLQRDLDDYRVATDLVDYLLKPNFGGPAFYTPILGAVLPFDGPNPIDSYPENLDISVTQVDGSPWEQTQYGEAFRVLKFWDTNKEMLHKTPLGRLDFNTKHVKLVVIDGQHRAMALLAIRRTIDRNWDAGTGGAYRYFYEKRINELLNNPPPDFLENIEFPVCICWFPHPTSDNSSWPNPHKAARKLFVDVNKNARSPSKSRLILLSDSELTSIFVREFLNHLRTKDARFPLHAIEYDYPHEQGEGLPVRSTALASILMLNSAIEWALRGPDKYIKDVNKTIQGTAKKTDKDRRLQHELEINKWLDSEIVDEGMNGPIAFVRNDLTNEHFPKTQLKTLIEKFWEGWGSVIMNIFAEFFPFKCHIEALKDLQNNWTAGAAHAILANDAMFKGLGIYWTLKEDYEQWLKNNQTARSDGGKVQDRTETVKAWEIIQFKEKEFQEERAKKLFNRPREINAELLKNAENIYKRLFTQAFLSGAVLTLASLKYDLGYDAKTFKERAEVWIRSWNLALELSFQRIKIFDRQQKYDAFLDFTTLSPADAVYFRYLLLEFMQVSRSEEFTPEEKEAIASLLTQARKLYLDALVKDEEKTLKKTEPQLNPTPRQSKAKKNAKDRMSKFCRKWFSITQEQFKDWLEIIEQSLNQETLKSDQSEESEQDDFDDDN